MTFWLCSTVLAAVVLHGSVRKASPFRGLHTPEILGLIDAPGEPRPLSGAHPVQDDNLLETALSLSLLNELTDEILEKRVSALAQSLRLGAARSPESTLRRLLPSLTWFQARLVTPRDAATMRDDSKVAGLYGQAYADILQTLPNVETQAPQLEKMLGLLWLALADNPGQDRELKAPLNRSDRWLPPERTLRTAHQYALDVFFTSVKRSGVIEHGPPVYSISDGIVVAAADDWEGGDRPALYVNGGLSPKAGNGVIVYCPRDSRYYAYFHMDATAVETGSIVKAGQLLGNGGNTGTNARKRGHGAHLHIEIHETSGKAWTSYEIRRLLVNL